MQYFLCFSLSGPDFMRQSKIRWSSKFSHGSALYMCVCAIVTVVSHFLSLFSAFSKRASIVRNCCKLASQLRKGVVIRDHGREGSIALGIFMHFFGGCHGPNGIQSPWSFLISEWLKLETCKQKKHGRMMASGKWMEMDVTWVNDVNVAILCTFEVLQVATHVILSKKIKKYSHQKLRDYVFSLSMFRLTPILIVYQKLRKKSLTSHHGPCTGLIIGIHWLMAGLPFSSCKSETEIITSIPWPCLELLHQTTEGHQTHKFAQIPFLVNKPELTKAHWNDVWKKLWNYGKTRNRNTKLEICTMLYNTFWFSMFFYVL